MKNYNQIQNDLNQFIGTMNYYEIAGFYITDGVKYFIDLCPCAMQVLLSAMNKTVRCNLTDKMQFIVVNISELSKESSYNKFKIYSEPDKGQPHFWDIKTVCPKEISLPDGEYRIWYHNNVFLLPSEY